MMCWWTPLKKWAESSPQICEERKVFLKLTNFINVLTGNMRAAVFKSLDRYLLICRAKKNIEDINEVCNSIQAVVFEILEDS